MKYGAARRERVDGLRKRFGRVVFQQVAARTGGQHLLRERLGVVHRLDEHLRARQCSEDFSRRVQAVQLGHREIENHDVRPQLFRQFDGHASVFSLAAKLPLVPRGDDRAKTLPDHAVIVGDEDAQFFHGGEIKHE